MKAELLLQVFGDVPARGKFRSGQTTPRTRERKIGLAQGMKKAATRCLGERAPVSSQWGGRNVSEACDHPEYFSKFSGPDRDNSSAEVRLEATTLLPV